MKPNAASKVAQPKPRLPPKPAKCRTTLSPIPQDQVEPFVFLQKSPVLQFDQLSPLRISPTSAKPVPIPKIQQDWWISYPESAPSQNPRIDDKNSIKNGTRTTLTTSFSRTEPVKPVNKQFIDSFDHSWDSRRYPEEVRSEVRRPVTLPLSGCPQCNSMPNQRNDEVIQKQLSTSPSENSSSMTSSDGAADVIYDEPLVDFERKSLQKLIKSDGYVKFRSDVVGETESNRKSAAAQKHRKSNRCESDRRRLTPVSLDPSKNSIRPCRSSESLDKLDVLLDFSDCSNQFFSSGKPLRSSFVDPNGPPTRKSVYLELGEYQTLLKHSRNDEERVYSLPQPQCYGEDTLKAVKLITEKYDTFKRRQLRALSFREGMGANRKSIDDDGEDKSTATSPIPEGVKNNSVNVNTPVSPVSPEAPRDLPGIAKAIDVEPTKLSPTISDEAKAKTEPSRRSAAVKPSRTRPSEWMSLRDYCNTLAVDVDADKQDSGGLSRANLMRIELFYRSREATVYVCRCLADMFIGTSINDESCPMVHQHTGVPVWLLNSGVGVRGRELLIILAERETGFPLWQDKINYLSNYHEKSPGVHSLRVSGSLRKMVRLHMFCHRSAEEFLSKFQQIAADPQDDLWKVSTNDTKSKKAKKKKKRRLKVSKSSISQPCNFVHISCVDPADPNFRAAFSDLIPTNTGKSQPNSPDPSKTSDIVDANKAFDSVDDGSVCEFRPRLPTR